MGLSLLPPLIGEVDAEGGRWGLFNIDGNIKPSRPVLCTGQPPLIGGQDSVMQVITSTEIPFYPKHPEMILK